MDRRFERRLRPIAAIILVFFSWISIEPWNYAVWAQTASKDTSSTSKPSNSPAKKFEESLRGAQKIIGDLDQELTEGKDVALSLETLKGHENSLEDADVDIQTEFYSTTPLRS